MHKLVSKLIVYRNLPEDNLLQPLAELCAQVESGSYNKEAVISKIYDQIHRLLDIATVYGFNKNLWHNYLTYLLVSVETPFAITCEKEGACEGSVNALAFNDFDVFQKLFAYDFAPLEKELGINCFSIITNYQAVSKKETRYNKNISEKVQRLSEALANVQNAEAFYELVTDFYKAYGVGKLGLNKAFRLAQQGNGAKLVPIANTDAIAFDDLVGYERQKQALRENTEAFVAGRPANNVLLFGDSGTGKSSSIKALINAYYDQGLRLIEIYKHQFQALSEVIAQIKSRNYRFIIYMDDLSFEEFETEYKYLKAIIEGGLEVRPDNILIYATSNRRHLINETWKDRNDVTNEEGIYKSDTMQEKLSLVNRFGCTIYYGQPDQKEYFEIVKELAQREGLAIPEDELLLEAKRFELHHGGISGRTARQFINYMQGTKKFAKK
ncbi:ATP-binding protein [uncultured Phascolarctobacterium sp.]|uniref:ATP-binding protein n=1 Tax=uncultured Phascolarctobacterium sp. TaxID=512296 RepID=UPI00260A5ADC|nr:ATP-binding protein [uncultured Phascolarctobacterium sp.]